MVVCLVRLSNVILIYRCFVDCMIKKNVVYLFRLIWELKVEIVFFFYLWYN